ncbi:Uncharacterized protein APZ42_033820 [Daphnia magna]|uniref:RNA-directed DNA polymerase n=1 Tax=Daphnia magna TaxID=35525 RepID=A0A164KPX9_9CRUS|nr:Uncharacterized protein APZ42_033820 [Daphnia magna]
MSIQQKRSARYPTCGRSPSRRLHPELFSISGPTEGETANPFRLTAIAEKTSTAQKADPSPGIIVPPMFSATPNEDAMDWLERLELAATYNRWSNADKARNFAMYLEGALGSVSKADFLDLAKLHMEATMLANQKVWLQSLLAVSKEPTFVNAGNNPQPTAMTPEIVSILPQLNHTIKQLQLSSGPTNHSAPLGQRQGNWNGSGRNGRTTEGRYIFGYCSKVGHLDYRCFQNPASSLFRGATQPQKEQRSPPQQYPGGRPEFGRQGTQDQQWPVNHISTEAAMGETTTTDSHSVQKFRGFVWGCKIIIITDHEALFWLRTKKELAGRLARWSLCLLEYDVEIRNRNGKLHTNSNCLSRYPIPINETEEDDRCISIGALQYHQSDFLAPDTVRDIASKQRKVTKWREIVEKLESGNSAGRHFCLKEGRLFKLKTVGTKSDVRLCIPDEYKTLILRSCHDDVTSGHFNEHFKRSRNASSGTIWLRTSRTTYEHADNVKQEKLRKWLQLEHYNASKMLIVAVDYLTKWVELKALPSGKTDVVASLIVEQIALRHGVPESIISHRGKCFLADITQSVTIICFAYNTSRLESTEFSPFFLLYGRDLIFPIDLILGSLSDSQGDTEMSFANKMMENLTAARSIVRTRLSQVQEKQKRDYDVNHRDVTFQKENKVFVYNPTRKKGKSDKLLHRWVDPFIVVRQKTPVNYELSKGSEQTFTPFASIYAPDTGTAAGKKIVESDSREDVVGSRQRVIQAEKRLESTAKDLEESYVDKTIEAAKEDKSIEAAKDSSEKSKGAELEITTNDLEESDVEGSIDDAHESSDESEEEENVDSTDEEQLFADTDSDSGTGIIPPQIKFLSPKVFKAMPEHDAFDWLERYESTRAYNQWGYTELRVNFSMYLDGAARKWYLCFTLPTEWREEFLEAAKRFTDAKLLANRRNWPDAVLGVAATRAADVPIDFIRTLPKPAPIAADMELWKVIVHFLPQGAVESLKIQATPPPKRPRNEKTVMWGESERIYRNNNGVLKCYCCNGTGHMDIILAGLRWTACLVYFDDVIVYSSTIDLHVERPRLVLECLKKAGLKLKVSKCHFAENSLKVLGHIVDADGKTVALKVKKVQIYLGLGSYFRPHIKDFSIIARPLILLTKKNAVFDWGPDQESSFNTLKQALLAAPVVAHLNYDLSMEIIPDACGYGIGVVLAQRVEGQEHPLAYASRLLSSSEINYSITEKECLALVWAFKKFKGYLWGCKIVVVTDHQTLCWLLTKRDFAGRLARWSLSIQEYDIEIRYRSGKLHDNADCLWRCPLPVTEDQEEDRCGAIELVGSGRSVDFGPEEEFVAEQRRVPRPLKTVNSIVAWHMGVRRTLTKIYNRFFWERLAIDVTNYVKSCPNWQGRKGVNKRPAGFLQCIQVTRPFQKVGIDLLAALTQEVMKNLGSNHKTTSSYHPQANGLVERMNNTLAAMLSMYASADHKDWDETLPYVCFAYNTVRQESIGYSPFFLLYGREPMLPIDLELVAHANPRLVTSGTAPDYATQIVTELLKARALVHMRLGVAQDNHRREYDKRQAYMIEYFDFFINLDTAFESVEASLQWLRDLADALDEGLALLAFPPAQMASVLKAVNRQLPLGWAVSSEELWVTYREAMVTVAAVEGRFRLFIKIPIYDHAQQYTLFEIFSLPRATNNGTHGVAIGDLPNFLAVSTDLETFIDLSTADVRGCKQLERLICNFHTGLGKRGARKSCAISLFTNDTNRKLTQRRQPFKEWKGSEVAYLGGNCWMFSAITAHEVVFSCPIGSSQEPPQSLLLPPFGIFYVPSGCTARTEDWVFPASLDGRLEASLDPLVAPTLAAVGFNVAMIPYSRINEKDDRRIAAVGVKISDLTFDHVTITGARNNLSQLPNCLAERPLEGPRTIRYSRQSLPTAPRTDDGVKCLYNLILLFPTIDLLSLAISFMTVFRLTEVSMTPSIIIDLVLSFTPVRMACELVAHSFLFIAYANLIASASWI